MLLRLMSCADGKLPLLLVSSKRRNSSSGLIEQHKNRYDTEGKDRAFNTMQGSEGGAASASSFKKDEFKLLDEVVTNQIGMSDQFSYYSTRATITHLKFDNLWYPACPADRCNKKVNVEENGMWRCEKCSTTYPAPEYRYVPGERRSCASSVVLTLLLRRT